MNVLQYPNNMIYPERILESVFKAKLLILKRLFDTQKFLSRMSKKSKKAGRKCQEKIFCKVMLIFNNKKVKEQRKELCLENDTTISYVVS